MQRLVALRWTPPMIAAAATVKLIAERASPAMSARRPPQWPGRGRDLTGGDR
ncbi:hypothetical protein [Polaromonas sp. YR568]|uniref:hypothetical protein n=1 Tax=Polaromonas sp. YR568 TaxID=1855301 RepID=UPI0031383D53